MVFATYAHYIRVSRIFGRKFRHLRRMPNRIEITTEIFPLCHPCAAHIFLSDTTSNHLERALSCPSANAPGNPPPAKLRPHGRLTTPTRPALAGAKPSPPRRTPTPTTSKP